MVDRSLLSIRPGDRVRVEAGGWGCPWATVVRTLGSERVTVALELSGAELTVPHSMLTGAERNKS
tara:strand:- start:1892 stop:2086 length:195 start_codon:yes stop_codon:yes gene_type:complete